MNALKFLRALWQGIKLIPRGLMWWFESQEETTMTEARREDWYRVSFDLGIPQGTEFPKEWYEFFQWLVDGTKPFKTIGSLVIIPGLTTRGPVILDESADEMGG